MAKRKILFKAPFADFSGYATVARHFLLELYKQDVFDLYLEPIVWINSGNLDLPKEDQIILDSLLEKSQKLQMADVADMTLVHFSVAPEFVGKQTPFKCNIGFTMLETDKTTVTWRNHCNAMDAIIVPSTFCLSSFMQSGITAPIRIVPFGVDFDKYKPEGEKLLQNLPTKYNFLSVGQWLPQGDRKNIMGVVRTFLSLFKNNADVGLILKTYHESAGTRDKIAVSQTIQSIKKDMGMEAQDPPYIYLVHGAMDSEDIARLYRSADSFLLPSLGEAWGMPLIEAAASELPIITTGGTGAEAFLNPDSVILLDYETKPIGDTFNWPGVYEAYQQLTIPNMEEFARMVNRVYTNQDISKEAAVAQRKELIDRDFSWANAAKIFAQTVEEIIEDTSN